MKIIRVSLIIISVIGFCCLIIGFLPIIKEGSVKDFALNLGTEAIGIILVIFLIDRVIQNNRENERKHILMNASLQFRSVIETLIDDLWEMGIRSSPQDQFYNLSQFNSTQFIESVTKFNFTTESDYFYSNGNRMLVIENIIEHLSIIKINVNSFLNRYIYFLTRDEVILFEKLCNIEFIEYILSVEAVIRDMKIKIEHYRLLDDDLGKVMVSDYINIINKFIEFYNRYSTDKVIISGSRFGNPIRVLPSKVMEE